MTRWFGVAAAVLIATAVAEVVAFAVVARAIGPGWTLLALVATSVLGAWLVRREGVRGWRRFRTALNEGRAPGNEASDGLLGLVGALLLLLPGFVSDAAGLVLLAPPVRSVARRALRRATERRISSAAAGGVFGPRRVRAYRGPAAPGTPATTPPPATPSPAGGPAAIEGQIVDPEPRP